MVSDSSPAWLTILVVLCGLAVLASWYSVYRWSETGDHDGVPQTRASQLARKTVNVAFVLRVVLIIFFDVSGGGAAVIVTTVATVFLVGSIAAWAWFERERRRQAAVS